MSDQNVFCCKGHLVSNATLSYFQDQTPYCTFSVGNNKTWKNSKGEYESYANYFDFIIKGKYAESMAKYLTKGRCVNIVSRAKQQRWEKDGQKYSKVIFEVQDLDLQPVANGDNSNRQNSNFGANQPAETYQEEPAFIPFDEGSEDIPF